MRIIKQLAGHRIRTFFAILPVTIENNVTNTRETRWLEKVTVQEVYRDYSDLPFSSSHWEPIKFINS
jgi:hypothetical protein